MKKTILITAVIVLMGMAGFTQSFEKNSQAINLGLDSVIQIIREASITVFSLPFPDPMNMEL